MVVMGWRGRRVKGGGDGMGMVMMKKGCMEK